MKHKLSKLLSLIVLLSLILTACAGLTGGTATPTASSAPTQSAGSGSTGYAKFTPNWSGLDKDCPSRDEFLTAHDLRTDQVIFHPAPKVSWEPCQYVIEFKAEFYGKITLPLVNGWAYSLAPVSGSVTNMWGGDLANPTSTLQWGFSAKYGPAYRDSENGIWLDPENPCQWLIQDYRFGRYWRLRSLGLPDTEVPYYGRVGPYMTMPGNVKCPGWVPPELDQFVPESYLQAAAILGGLAIESQWQHSADNANWAWKYSGDGKFRWQTVYVPQSSRGYVEIWVNGAPKKFYASDLAELMLGNLNAEEFSYHAFPDR